VVTEPVGALHSSRPEIPSISMVSFFGACRLFRDVAGVAERTRRTYPYWQIDAFQDTSPARYRLVQLVAGDRPGDWKL
jgi:hypothetical protein